jgi:hypothetical protein
MIFQPQQRHPNSTSPVAIYVPSSPSRNPNLTSNPERKPNLPTQKDTKPSKSRPRPRCAVQSIVAKATIRQSWDWSSPLDLTQCDAVVFLFALVKLHGHASLGISRKRIQQRVVVSGCLRSRRGPILLRTFGIVDNRFGVKRRPV